MTGVNWLVFVLALLIPVAFCAGRRVEFEFWKKIIEDEDESA